MRRLRERGPLSGWALRLLPAPTQTREGSVQWNVMDEFELSIEELDVGPIGASVAGQKPGAHKTMTAAAGSCDRLLTGE